VNKERSIVLLVDLLVNLNWCIHQLRRVGSFEITTALLGGDPAGYRRALRAAAKDEGMRVHTRITTTGLRAWNPDHASTQ
jgi:hypothetical protein